MLSDDLLVENQKCNLQNCIETQNTVRFVTHRISTASEIWQAAILDRYGVETFRKRYYFSSK